MDSARLGEGCKRSEANKDAQGEIGTLVDKLTSGSSFATLHALSRAESRALRDLLGVRIGVSGPSETLGDWSVCTLDVERWRCSRSKDLMFFRWLLETPDLGVDGAKSPDLGVDGGKSRDITTGISGSLIGKIGTCRGGSTAPPADPRADFGDTLGGVVDLEKLFCLAR